MSVVHQSLPGPIVDAAWLADHLAEVRLVDVRWSMDDGPQRADHLAGHLPGAVFADLDADLSDPPGPAGRHPLPSAAHFAEVRSVLDLVSMPVVAYDDRSGSVAGRLWWMLDAIGHTAAVLDGGMAAWPGPLEAGEVTVAPQPVDAVAWPADRFVVADRIEAAIAEGAIMLDARSVERFRGDPNPIDPRFGHVPGSVSRPWTDNVGPDGRFLPAEQLHRELSELGVDGSRSLITSCGSGVTGCHDLLAARIAGFDGGRLYTGSWSEWGLDPARPLATDPPV